MQMVTALFAVNTGFAGVTREPESPWGIYLHSSSCFPSAYVEL